MRIKLNDAHESVFTLSSELPQYFICTSFTKNIFYFVWYSEEITGLEILYLSPAFNIY